MEISKPFHRDMRKYDSFVISMCIEGDCIIRPRAHEFTVNHEPLTLNHEPFTLNHASFTMNHEPLTLNHEPLTLNQEFTLREGHSTLIPAAIADYDVIPLHSHTRLLDAFIDNQPDSISRTITRFLHIGTK